MSTFKFTIGLYSLARTLWSAISCGGRSATCYSSPKIQNRMLSRNWNTLKYHNFTAFPKNIRKHNGRYFLLTQGKARMFFSFDTTDLLQMSLQRGCQALQRQDIPQVTTVFSRWQQHAALLDFFYKHGCRLEKTVRFQIWINNNVIVSLRSSHTRGQRVWTLLLASIRRGNSGDADGEFKFWNRSKPAGDIS